MLRKSLGIAAALVLSASSMVAGASPRQGDRFTEHIRKELAKIPTYGVYDNLAFEVKGDTVILTGQVRRPTTRKDAERRVKRIEGVEQVINRIEVLPPSPMDDSIRRRSRLAISRTGGLYRYFLGANPSIHIIVNRGHVTLEGVVANSMDSQLAYTAANQVPGVFSVTNNLRIEKK
ncbi:MAG TPA: BON domain-containing protein [Blastocatellia bacterium]|nr:BON domain-containing protein [Blastocatellia bacterium]